MSDDTPVTTLLAPMKEREVDLQGDAFRVDRSAALARMAAASRPPPRRWAAYAGALAAAIVLLSVGAAWRIERARGGIAVVVLPGSDVRFETVKGEEKTLSGSTVVASGGVLDVGAGSGARVTTADGVGIELEGNTRVALEASPARGSRLELRRGAIRCTVAHRASQPFLVVAPGITVVDLGTVFTVAIDPATQATSVSVDEGEVLVAHGEEETRVKAKERWSSVDDSGTSLSAPSPPAASAPVATPPASAPDAQRAPTKKGRASPPEPRGATLDEESRLLRLGLAAERQGRAADAVSLLEQLLSRYPKSPLAPDAREALRRVKQNAP